MTALPQVIVFRYLLALQWDLNQVFKYHNSYFSLVSFYNLAEDILILTRSLPLTLEGISNPINYMYSESASKRKS